MKIEMKYGKNFLNRKMIFSIFILLALFSLTKVSHAQDVPTVKYSNDLVLDTDMDGLTDKGETQVFGTDPKKIDTDKDGYEDGVEALAGHDPSNGNDFPGKVIAFKQQKLTQSEIPWAWYVTRASGLVAFLLLYVSIFLGLTLRIPLLRRMFLPIYSMKIHCWISVQAMLFALIHGMALLFDKMFAFTLIDVFVPFASKYEPDLIALGILGLYLMVILVLTSYGRRFLSQKIWRITHFTNIVLYGAVFAHALYLGTDMKNSTIFWTFIWANAFLVFIMLLNIELRITDALKKEDNPVT